MHTEITRDDQKRIVNELLDGMRKRLLDAIDTNKMPDYFCGHELRVLVEKIASENASYLNKGEYRRHKQDALNAYIVNNI